MSATAETSATPSVDAEFAEKVRAYTVGEEIANSIIHGIGITLSISALTLLIVFAVQAHDGWALGAGIVYGTASHGRVRSTRSRSSTTAASIC